MNNGKSYLQKELVSLRRKTYFLIVIATIFPFFKNRCESYFLKKTAFLMDIAECGLLTKEDLSVISSIAWVAIPIDCSWWCYHVIECHFIVEDAWKAAGNS
ncbi:hypothetical protein AB6J01_004819 [Klebsiella pneumoniae]|nr:hypothetical protein [Proteus mirabilis]